MSSPESAPKLKQFVREKAAQLIENVEARMSAVLAAHADEASVHALRTSLRRLGECLRTFEPLFPNDEAQRVRRRLRTLMKLAAEVRNRDIAEKLFVKARVAPNHALFERLQTEKAEWRRELTAKIEDWIQRERPKRWRVKLGAK